MALRYWLNTRSFLFFIFYFLILTSCSVQQKISKSAKQLVLKDSSLLAAHIGISIYDPGANKYWYNYNGEKYFVPASNTKIPTCYAAMKYLGDSLKCFSVNENDTALFILPAGDPTFLHPGYENQTAYDFLKNTYKKIYLTDKNWKEEALGSGWSWNDYNDYYMAERSPMPIYGNLVLWKQRKTNDNPPYFIYSEPEINWEVNFSSDTSQRNFKVQRSLGENKYELIQGKERYKEINVPFVTNGIKATLELLPDTLGKPVLLLQDNKSFDYFKKTNTDIRIVKSQPTDSMLTPMMHESDNFFAEQSLLMVSNERLGYMSDEKIIDTILKTDFKDLPQKPRWVDGSGLSRYNLFSPQDFVFILNKMKNEFGMDRIKVILATGGTGTISNYYKADSGFIFAKTGTLGGVVALSGYLYTKKGKLLIFSTLVNNHQASSTAVRRAVEKFIHELIIKN
jgi:D-alanyl-D-alanine carboxypeptidase/D-alanyl-D-alanine-endopeptidase (penicillin-binding protein 4)